MCLLTFFPDGVYPTPAAIKALDEGAKFNPDGYGYAMIAGDEILVRKGMDSELVLDLFLEDRKKYPKGPALFHSRIGTDGLTDESNCHPFYVGKDRKTVLAHNGILPRLARPKSLKDRRSDTRILAEVLLPEKPFGYFHSQLARDAFSEWMGPFNKVIILTTNPRYPNNVLIFNQDRGHWNHDAWWSNDSYCGYRSTKKAAGAIVLGPRPGLGTKDLSGIIEDLDEIKKCPSCNDDAVDKDYRVCWSCGNCADCLASWTNGECLCRIPGRGIRYACPTCKVYDPKNCICDTIDTLYECPECHKNMDACTC